MGLQSVGHDQVTENSTALIMGGDTGNWGSNKIYVMFFGRNIPTLGFRVSCPINPSFSFILEPYSSNPMKSSQFSDTFLFWTN